MNEKINEIDMNKLETYNIETIKNYLKSKNEIKKGESEMKKIIEDIVKALVDKPEEVVITETRGSNLSILEIKVDLTDVSKIIGKQGRIATSLRNIAKAIAGKNRERVVVEILQGYPPKEENK
jgi:uncharacterized protein